MLVISNVLVISLPFTLRDVGVFLFPFFESISLMDFQVFLISDLYFSNENAKNCFLSAHNMFVLNILLYVLRFILNFSYSLEAGLVNLIFL